MGTLGILVLFQAGVVGRQMPNVHRSTTELTAVPNWLYTPSSVRLALPTGVRLELMTMTVVSSDERREAALIGVLHNRSRAMSGAVLRLSYIGPDGQSVLRSVPNAASVSEVPVDGLLPFRFALLVDAAVPGGVTAFEMSIAERIGGARRTMKAHIKGDVSIRGQRGNAASVIGDVEIQNIDVPLPDSTRMFVTLVLRDKNDNLLEVLSGTPISQGGLNSFRVRFESFLPLTRRVKTSQVYVEAVRSDATPKAVNPLGAQTP